MSGPVSGRDPSGQAGRATPGAAEASPPSGDHPSRVKTWITKRLNHHRADRLESRALGDELGMSAAVGAMLELHELREFLLTIPAQRASDEALAWAQGVAETNSADASLVLAKEDWVRGVLKSGIREIEYPIGLGVAPTDESLAPIAHQICVGIAQAIAIEAALAGETAQHGSTEGESAGRQASPTPNQTRHP